MHRSLAELGTALVEPVNEGSERLSWKSARA
jgi:hypothetical protein